MPQQGAASSGFGGQHTPCGVSVVQQADAAAASQICRPCAAHAGFRQIELDARGGFMIARERGGDRAHLLMPGREQESRRAAVALHAGDEEIGLRMRQLIRAMRANRAAAVQIGIDQRADAAGAFEPRIERQPYLPQHRKVRPESGRDDDLIDRESRPVRRHDRPRCAGAALSRRDLRDAERRQHLDRAAFDQMRAPGCRARRAPATRPRFRRRTRPRPAPCAEARRSPCRARPGAAPPVRSAR